MRALITSLLLLVACVADAQLSLPPPPVFAPVQVSPHVVERPAYAYNPLRRALRHGVRRTVGDGAGTPPGGGGCSSGSAWPGGPNFCPDDVEAEMNSILGSSRGTTVKPVPPTLPSGGVTTFSGAAADTAAEVESAIMTAGWAQITLGADIAGVGVHQGGSGATDVTIYLNGFTMDSLVCGYGAGNAARITIVGTGVVGTILCFLSNGSLVDLIVHGAWMGPDFQGTPASAPVIDTSGYGGPTLSRWSFTSTIARGYTGAGSDEQVFIGAGTSMVVVNSNWSGGDDAIVSENDWVWRSVDGSEKHWMVDTYMRAYIKPVVRTGASVSQVVYTTDTCVDAACASTLVHSVYGNIDPAQDNGGGAGVDNDLILRIRTEMIHGDTGAASTGLWGPDTVSTYWFAGGNDHCAEDTALFQSSDLTTREAAAPGGETWLLNETYDGQSTTVTHSDPITGCIPAWPNRDAPELDPTIANSTFSNVGDDPFDAPP